MQSDHKVKAWRDKDGRTWRVGGGAEVAWIEKNTRSGVTITSAIPPGFDAYATLELPGSGPHQVPSSRESWEQLDKELDRHDAGVLAVLSDHSGSQPWWLGYLDTGAADLIFKDAHQVRLYADWAYVLIEAGPEEAAVWRDGRWKGTALPDLMFPSDRSWLFSTLWDDDWTYIGGSRGLVNDFLAHPHLRDRVRGVDSMTSDATPPGHTAI